MSDRTKAYRTRHPVQAKLYPKIVHGSWIEIDRKSYLPNAKPLLLNSLHKLWWTLLAQQILKPDDEFSFGD